MASAAAAQPANFNNTAKYIKMKDLAAFKWMIINIFGHDYMHDFLINTGRTAKEKSIIDQINKLIKIIAKYKNSKTNKISQHFVNLDVSPNTASKGGALFEIDEEGIHSGSIIVTPSYDINPIQAYNLDKLEMTIDQHLVLSNSLNDMIEKAVMANILPSRKGDTGINSDIIMQNIERWTLENREMIKQKGEGAILYFENAITIAKEELYIEDLMINGMKENFKALAESLVSLSLHEPIKNLIELTGCASKFLNPNFNEWEEHDDRTLNIEAMIREFENEVLPINIERETRRRAGNLKANEINKQIFGNLFKLDPRDVNTYKLSGRKVQK